MFYLINFLNSEPIISCAFILGATTYEQNGGQIYAPRGFRLTTTPFARRHADAFEFELHHM